MVEKLSLLVWFWCFGFFVFMPEDWIIRNSRIVLVCGVLQLIPPLAIHSSYPSKRALFFLPKKLVKFQFHPGFVRCCLGKAWQFVIELNCFNLVQVPWGSFFTKLLNSKLACPCASQIVPFVSFLSAAIPVIVEFWSDSDGTGMRAGRESHRRLPLSDSIMIYCFSTVVGMWRMKRKCSIGHCTAPFAKRRIQFKRKRYQSAHS